MIRLMAPLDVLQVGVHEVLCAVLTVKNILRQGYTASAAASQTMWPTQTQIPRQCRVTACG